MKLALGGAAGMAGTTAMVALQGGVAGAQCTPECQPGTQQCCTTNTAPNVPFCAPAGYACCGNEACPPNAQCCTTAVPNFCAPSGLICCGRFACAPLISQCCLTGSEPHCEPAIYTCCGNVSCPPNFICQGYPAPSTCVPAP
jgi:hypothetical protein